MLADQALLQRQLRNQRTKPVGQEPCTRGIDCHKTHDTWGYHVTVTTYEGKDYYMSDITDTPAESSVGEVFDLTSTLSESDAEKVAQAFERIRPLDKDQKANLLDILQEDYWALKRQVSAAFDSARRKAREEVLAQFPEPESQVERFKIEAEELLKAQDKAFRKLIKRAKKENVEIEDSYFGRTAFTDRVKYLVVTQQHDTTERDQALYEAIKPIDRAEQAAIREIDRIQHEANRKIRLASISKDASEILSTLPKANDIVAKLDEAVTAAHAEIESEKASGTAHREARRGILGRKR